MLLKIWKIQTKVPVLEALFNKIAGPQSETQETPEWVISCKFCEICKNSFFIKHL